MKVVAICILLFQSIPFLKAQNLIRDSSFESNKFIPTDFSSLKASNSWGTASWGTTDLFCKCGRKQKKYSMVNVPQNPMGFQEAHSGTCYAGFFAYSHGNYREYLQTELSQPLEKNKTYQLTLYVSLSDYSPTAIDQLGVCFLNKAVGYNSSEVITGLKPVYLKLENKIRKDVTNWHRISVTYKSQGGESFMLLGSFEIHTIYRTRLKAPKELKSQINKTSERDSYYYIDDVSLVETIPPPETDTIVNSMIELPANVCDTVITFKNVVYKTNKSTLMPASYAELDQVARYLQDNKSIRVEIAGHTDNSGNERSNKKLSEERAKTVANYLILKTHFKDRITYRGYGSLKPVASNGTEEGKFKNRRVEFIITK